jgi:hypothetical protein
MVSTGGDTVVDPKEKWAVGVGPNSEHVRLNGAETGPFTGTLYKSSCVIDANALPPPAKLPSTAISRELSVKVAPASPSLFPFKNGRMRPQDQNHS